MTAAKLLNSTVKNQIYLEGLKSNQANQFTAFLKRIDLDLRERLTADDLTDFSRSRLEKLLKSVENTLIGIMDEYYDELAGHLVDIAQYESEFEAENLANAIASELFESVIPSPEQVRSAVFNNPLSVRGADGGKLLKPFIKDWMASDVKMLSGIIRQGFFEGQTNFEILRNIRGTKANRYTDGALAVVDRHAKAIVRTAVQHSASTARMQTWIKNGIKQYTWLSTLDGRTSTICRSLDQEVYDIGKGPVPPIHINCRSTTMAKLPDKYNYLDKDATRASKNGPVDAKLGYYEWMKLQDAEFQDDVLGPARGNLLRNGGLTAEKFKQLQLDKNFKPLTLAEMRKKEPKAFSKAYTAAPKTKQAENVKIAPSKQQASLTNWLGEERYRKFAGSLENPRIKNLMGEYGMTQAEGVAVRAYTATGYEELNNRQWGLSVQNPQAVDDSAEVLRSALSKMPSYEGISYRRTSLPAKILEQHEVGNVVTYPAFTSSSYDQEVFSGNHRIVIHGRTGKKVGWNSVFNEQEREVVHTSPTDFFVESRYIDSDGILTFRLTEI